MQMNFDLTDTEIANLKRKIDKLDPVVQSEAVIKYLGKYTQKHLGEKLGKTRDWVAKRVQFIRALEKLPESERKEVTNLVRDNVISIEIVILVADLPKEQRLQIIFDYPTVSEAKRLIYIYRQGESAEARLKVLEGQLSKAYIEFEEMVGDELFNFGMTHSSCGDSIPFALNQEIGNFLKLNWYENYRYGREVYFKTGKAKDQQMLSQRIVWLELPENDRIKVLQKTIVNCRLLYRSMIKALESQARQVPSLVDTIKSLRLQLGLMKMNNPIGTGGFSINFGNGIPPLVLNIANDQFKILHRALAMAFHPDKHPEDKPQYEEIMKTLNIWHDKVAKSHKEAH